VGPNNVQPQFHSMPPSGQAQMDNGLASGAPVDPNTLLPKLNSAPPGQAHMNNPLVTGPLMGNNGLPQFHSMSPGPAEKKEDADDVIEEEDWEPLKVQPYSNDMSVMGRLRAIAALEGYPPDDTYNYLRWTFASWARKSDIMGACFATDDELQCFSPLERMCVVVHTMLVALFSYRLFFSATACSYLNSYGYVSDENGKQFYYWMPGLLVPVFRLLFLTWLIKLIFMKPMENETSVIAHGCAGLVFISTAGIALIMLFNGPREEDPCGPWVFHQPAISNLGYWFVSWLISETIVQYCVYVAGLAMVQAYRKVNSLPSSRKEYKEALKSGALEKSKGCCNSVGRCLGRCMGDGGMGIA